MRLDMPTQYMKKTRLAMRPGRPDSITRFPATTWWFSKPMLSGEKYFKQTESSPKTTVPKTKQPNTHFAKKPRTHIRNTHTHTKLKSNNGSPKTQFGPANKKQTIMR